LRHLLGLALARSGATLQANQIALQLRADGPTESGVLEDTLGLLGRTLKDIALSEHDRTRRRARFREAHDAYLEALNRAPSSYSAINAASTALFAGHDAAAVQLARSARELAITELEREEAFGHSTFWQRATLGEAALLLGEREEAKRQFAVATAYARTHRKYGDLASTRRQARLILEERGEAPEWLDSALRAPTVVIFSGHSIDMPDRATPLYPPELEERVRRAIDERLEQLDAGFGFSSAANGGEIQFQEAMRSRGGETYVVLPYGEAEFCETNVRGLPSGDWISRYNAVLAAASECVAATGQPSMQRGVLFQYANSLMLGMAMLRARTLDTRLVALTLWDRHSSSAAGSTASVVRAWRRAGHNVEIIDIGAIAGSRVAAP
jgi:tetratricopeptide (TPR) repeat protein